MLIDQKTTNTDQKIETRETKKDLKNRRGSQGVAKI